ncbi:MAG: imidazole glycerol phosphate synthase subunit HisH [Pirellulales bacterium]
MSTPAVTIIDYQMGNLRSVQKALEYTGAEALVTDDPKAIASAERLILPGVGAFGDAIRELRSRDLESPIRDFLASGRPFLGICLGLQMLFESGDEGGFHEGLGVLPGRVERFNLDASYKVPHMGWNSVENQIPDHPLLAGVHPRAQFYFVHSFYVVPHDQSTVWLTCDYGVSFTAAVSKGNIHAVQFHPEKSQKEGLKLLENFSRLSCEPKK